MDQIGKFLLFLDGMYLIDLCLIRSKDGVLCAGLRYAFLSPLKKSPSQERERIFLQWHATYLLTLKAKRTLTSAQSYDTSAAVQVIG